MKKQKIILLLGAAILLLSFTKKKKTRGSVEVGPLQTNNMYAKKNSILFDSPFANKILVNFRGGELLTFIKQDIDDYFVEYVKPGGTIVRGYINKSDVNFK